MVNKYLLFLLLIVFSCTSKQPSIENIDAEIKFIELHKSIDSLNSKISAVKVEKSYKKEDSLNKILDNYRNELESLSSNSGLNLELTEKNCINYFGLDSNSLNEQKVNYLFLYNAYKVCEPRYVSCGFGPSIATKEDANRYLARLSNAESNYNNYIDSTLSVSIKRSFPMVKKNEIITFYHSSEVVLEKYNLFDKSFYDSACVYLEEDSIFMNLYTDMEKARFSDL